MRGGLALASSPSAAPDQRPGVQGDPARDGLGRHHGKMGAGGSSEASVPGGPPVAGSEPGAAGAAGGGAQWGAFVVLLFLGLLVAYCCWGAPCCRGCCCRPRKNSAAAAHPRAHEDSGVQAEDALGSVCTPTIILLPQGRMLVVDGAVLSSLQADASGLDLIRLGENLVRAQRRQVSKGKRTSTDLV
ncbi:uncharacterized protein LOC113205432 [Frankliniella occidentalis]|uniref:Uncharacterized protein LOC113205432 n=1 Tax=Frankliniella occidentalis TaxID=133901 RepID=A0A9C6U4S5_FRAOC|nr:uncharacterized protein LOC113205432 [Frankliniella occidentalis]